MDGTLHGGEWTRWGRGSCVGYSLSLGDVVRGQVVRNIDNPPTWRASVNAVELGNHPSAEAAKAVIEAHIIQNMRVALGDWAKFEAGAGRPKR